MGSVRGVEEWGAMGRETIMNHLHRAGRQKIGDLIVTEGDEDRVGLNF